MNRRRTEFIAIAVLMVVVIGYAAAGLVVSVSRVAGAERTLNAVVSHQNTLNSTFRDINAQLGQLSSGSAFNPEQAIILVDKSISNSELATKTIEEDDASLVSASSELQSARWLTLVGQSSLDREATRLGHARNALGSARTYVTDELQDGHFWHSLYAGLNDMARLRAQVYANDLQTASATLVTLKTDVDSGAQLSTSPGLPAALHKLMVDMQTLESDFGKDLDARLAGDDGGIASADEAISADLQKIAGYDFDQIAADITAYYKPLLDRFNAEIAAATS
ncbi:MAG TPA: hypothetical protein VFL27_02485 [Candidatus Dormibacteraeota bacterium]|nr:hypothetical protein [Candidatus Dormibacteraeota bacterium]